MRKRDQQGASAVEFALVLPVLVLLTLGIIQFGAILGASQGLEAAAREGGRVASLGRDADQGEIRRAVVNTSIPFVLDSEVLDIEAEPRCGDPNDVAEGDDPPRITVTVRLSGGDYGFNEFAFWGENTILNPDLVATATFRCEAEHTSW